VLGCSRRVFNFILLNLKYPNFCTKPDIGLCHSLVAYLRTYVPTYLATCEGTFWYSCSGVLGPTSCTSVPD
jgi:hypothetical protein